MKAKFEFYNDTRHWPTSRFYDFIRLKTSSHLVKRSTVQKAVGSEALSNVEKLTTPSRKKNARYASGRLGGKRAYLVVYPAVTYVFKEVGV